jgi:tetratricopeptide (TPR) repeat protein
MSMLSISPHVMSRSLVANLRMTRTPSTYEQVRQFWSTGRKKEALQLVPQMLAEMPHQPSALMLAGGLAYEVGDYQTCVARYRRATELDPTQVRQWLMLGRALIHISALEDASAAFQQGLKLDPGNVALLASQASIFERRGRNQEAYDMLAPLMSGSGVDGEVTMTFASVCHHLDRHDEAIKAIRQLNPQLAITPTTRVRLMFLLGRILEEQEKYEEAFEAYAEGNRIRREHGAFDVDRYKLMVDLLVGFFSPGRLASLPRSTNLSEAPVVVGGMPRSGTTLTEQIIQAHPRGHGAGEPSTMDRQFAQLASVDPKAKYPEFLAKLATAQLDQAASKYLADVSAGSGGAARIVDKYLRNPVLIGFFWQVLPRSRVIWTHRDPMDTCFSCFTSPLKANVHAYASDLTHLGVVYRQHERLMRHWRDTLDLPFLEFEYEAAVADSEPWIRRLIDFCGLEWDERCLRPHEADRTVLTISYDQVRRPINDSSIGRWRKFERWLEPLRKSLEENHTA